VGLVEADKAKTEFEQLLAAAWAEQLAQLHTPPDSGDSQAGPDSQETTGKEGDLKTLRDKEVFVACTGNVGDRVYAMRDEHGDPASPQSSEQASQKTMQKRESL